MDPFETVPIGAEPILFGWVRDEIHQGPGWLAEPESSDDEQ